MDKMQGLVNLLRDAAAENNAIIDTLDGIVTGQPLDNYREQELTAVLEWLGELFALRYGDQPLDGEAETVAAMTAHEDRLETQQEIIEDRLYFYLYEPVMVS